MNTIPSFGSQGESTESQNTNNANNTVSEQDIIRVSEQAQKAGQMRQQIRDQAKENNKFAQFLAFLLEECANNDELIKLIFSAFFKDGNNLVTQNISIEPLVGLFAIFYEQKTVELDLMNYYGSLFSIISVISQPTDYTKYVSQLMKKYPELTTIDKNLFVELIIETLYRKKILIKGSLSPDEEKNNYMQILDSLYASVL
ncbi:MAG TPA: hypothetical protein PKD96_01310 [Candidatus Absconditabacterales bacterium]|nr:hypothetical protein [Candidatus Absconditabacterales bacterium]HMT26917.1 hypothetical protein [Candidatus Absconditabacterales bacterium]